MGDGKWEMASAGQKGGTRGTKVVQQDGRPSKPRRGNPSAPQSVIRNAVPAQAPLLEKKVKKVKWQKGKN